MGSEQICQSCGVPLNNPESRGTEKNGRTSNDYCLYCYKQGRFTQPDITLPEMQLHIIAVMKKKNVAHHDIYTAVSKIPDLKRWSSATENFIKEKRHGIEPSVPDHMVPSEVFPEAGKSTTKEEDPELIPDGFKDRGNNSEMPDPDETP